MRAFPSRWTAPATMCLFAVEPRPPPTSLPPTHVSFTLTIPRRSGAGPSSSSSSFRASRIRWQRYQAVEYVTSIVQLTWAALTPFFDSQNEVDGRIGLRASRTLIMTLQVPRGPLPPHLLPPQPPLETTATALLDRGPTHRAPRESHPVCVHLVEVGGLECQPSWLFRRLLLAECGASRLSDERSALCGANA